MDTKQISFNERPDTVTLYLIVDFDPRQSNSFFVQIRGVVNLRCALKLRRGWILCWTWKVFSVPFTFFNLNEDFWIAPFVSVWTLLSFILLLYFSFLYFFFLFFRKSVEPGFTKVQNQSPSEVSLYDPPCGVLELLYQLLYRAFFCCCWSISVCHLKVL